MQDDLKDLKRNEAGIALVLGILKQRFGEKFNSSQSIRQQHTHTTTYLRSQLPDGVVWPQSTQEVSEIVSVCAEHKVPIIPFGTGTSLEGGVNAPAGGICIDLQEMDAIVAVNSEDFDATVQAGVTREALNEHLRDQGLFFAVDPGANASLGGMASTRASGTNAVRYGTMRENVISLTVVMADGQIIKTANRASKSSTGYDLTRLMVGSEGTLGVITELTLKLHGIPEAISAGSCSFPSVEAACNTTIMAMQSGIPMARIELMDADIVACVNEYSKLDLPVKPLLLLEFHGSESAVKEQAKAFGEIAAEFGGEAFQWAEKTEERNRLWAARHSAYWALKAKVGDKGLLTTDICVPISRLAECVTLTQQDISEAGLYGPIVGHVGDGNFHAAMCVDLNNDEEISKVEAIAQRMAMRALEMDGTCSGEHGIGQGKIKFMAIEHGAGADIMAAIKTALDPDNIMNPGKIIPV
ncbi:MAG: FAD-binding protein [Rhizobiaceae bacterium]|nr:FAD-binding protein [Rhizobiaceae bacterium]